MSVLIQSLPLRLITDGLRDYGVEGQLGLEKTLDEYLTKMLLITSELKRVLKKTGTMWLNWGDSYSARIVGSGGGWSGENAENYPNPPAQDKSRFEPRTTEYGIPEKCLAMQNYRMAIRMVDEQQWILRNILIWHKPSCMPSSAKDRFTVDWEPVFFFSKNRKYWFEPQYEPGMFDPKGVRGFREGNIDNSHRPKVVVGQQTHLGRNKRCVWKIPTQPTKDAHFATFPEKLIEPMVKAGCPEFICKKCGRAREKIIETKTEKFNPRKDEKYSGGTEFMSKKTTLRSKTKTVERGYKECDCEPEQWADFDILGKPIQGIKSKWRPGIVLDPFMGSGTVAVVANKLNRDWIGIELSKEYIKIAEKRIRNNPKPML